MKTQIQSILRTAGLLQDGEVLAGFGDAIQSVTLVEYKSKNAIALRIKCDGSNSARFAIYDDVKDALYEIHDLSLAEVGASDKTRKGSGYMSARATYQHAVIESTTYSFYIRLRSIKTFA
jgi:hypothetical protein